MVTLAMDVLFWGIIGAFASFSVIDATVVPIPNALFITEARKYCYNPSPTNVDPQYGHISEWDTSQVTSMRGAFGSCSNFNSDISKWDVSKVTTFVKMFERAYAFNADISKWDVSKVTSLRKMFYVYHNGPEPKFNADISNWDVSSVTNMEYTFKNQRNFNINLITWDTSKVRDMWDMFLDRDLRNSARGDINVALPYIAFWDTRNVRSNRRFLPTTKYVPVRNHPCPSGLRRLSDIGAVSSRCAGVQPLCDSNPCGPHSTYCVPGHIDVNNGNLIARNELPVTCRCMRGYSGPTCDTFTPDTFGDLRDAVLDWCSSPSPSPPFIQDWDISLLNHLDYAFSNITYCPNGFNVSLWDVQHITSMKGTFEGNTVFNEDISPWSVENVTNFEDMFNNASLFQMEYTTYWNTGGVLENQSSAGVVENKWVLKDQPCPVGYGAPVKLYGSFEERCVNCAMGYKWITDDCVLNLCNHTLANGSNTVCSGKVDLCTISQGPTRETTNVSCGCPAGYIGDYCEFFQPLNTTQLQEGVTAWCNTDEMDLYPIADWNLDKVQAFDYVFANIGTCRNQLDIGGWNVSGITSMKGTFSNSTVNEDIGFWTVDNVVDMEGMFSGNAVFNQNLSKWETSSVRTMSAMFGQPTMFELTHTTYWDTSGIESNETALENQPCALGYEKKALYGTFQDRCQPLLVNDFCATEDGEPPCHNKGVCVINLGHTAATNNKTCICFTDTKDPLCRTPIEDPITTIEDPITTSTETNTDATSTDIDIGSVAGVAAGFNWGLLVAIIIGVLILVCLIVACVAAYRRRKNPKASAVLLSGGIDDAVQVVCIKDNKDDAVATNTANENLYFDVTNAPNDDLYTYSEAKYNPYTSIPGDETNVKFSEHEYMYTNNIYITAIGDEAIANNVETDNLVEIKKTLYEDENAMDAPRVNYVKVAHKQTTSD